MSIAQIVRVISHKRPPLPSWLRLLRPVSSFDNHLTLFWTIVLSFSSNLVLILHLKGPSIKADPTSSLSFSPVSATPDNPLKRTSSDPIDEPAKRQRLPDDEFTRLLALATQNTNLQLEQNRPGSSTPQSQNAAPVPETPNVQSSLTSDPYLYMRIFSLPILESLVCTLNAPADWFKDC